MSYSIEYEQCSLYLEDPKHAHDKTNSRATTARTQE